jgi:hypothetical protein
MAKPTPNQAPDDENAGKQGGNMTGGTSSKSPTTGSADAFADGESDNNAHAKVEKTVRRP